MHWVHSALEWADLICNRYCVKFPSFNNWWKDIFSHPLHFLSPPHSPCSESLGTPLVELFAFFSLPPLRPLAPVHPHMLNMYTKLNWLLNILRSSQFPILFERYVVLDSLACCVWVFFWRWSDLFTLLSLPVMFSTVWILTLPLWPPAG